MTMQNESIGGLTGRITGIWTATPYPMREVTLVFCPDEKGIHFLYWGSDENSPVVDEFAWQIERDGVLRITWLQKHALLLDDEDETPGTAVEPSTEVITFRREPGELIFTDSFEWDTDGPFRYAGPARSFDEERSRWQQRADEFEPSKVWLVNDQHGWQPVPNAVVIEEEKPTPTTPVANGYDFQHLLHGRKPWLFFCLLLGTFGVIGMLADYHKGVLPEPVFITLAMLQWTIFIFRPDFIEDPVPLQWFLRLRQFGAVWFLLLCLLSFVALATGFRTKDTPFFIILMLFGLIPVIRVLHPRYGNASQ
ncbi:MAG: hypothetical protein ACYDCO_06845 [Armatimonadota bacterium]